MYAKNSRTKNSWNQIVNRFHEKIYLLEDEVDLDLELSSLEFSDESEPEADASCLRLIFLRSKSNAVGFFRFKFGGLFNGRLGSRATSVILTMEISSSESGTSPWRKMFFKYFKNNVNKQQTKLRFFWDQIRKWVSIGRETAWTHVLTLICE